MKYFFSKRNFCTFAFEVSSKIKSTAAHSERDLIHIMLPAYNVNAYQLRERLLSWNRFQLELHFMYYTVNTSIHSCLDQPIKMIIGSIFNKSKLSSLNHF